jgi:general secretion pathway protein H
VRREADKHLRGFTLVELVIVLLIIGIASALAAPALDRAVKKRETRQSVLALAATARDLRRRAIDQGTLKRLTVEPRANSYLASDGEIIRLPENIAITGASGGEPIGQRLTQYVFFPNGSIVGGEIELTDRAGAAYVIRMEAMVGRVVVIRQ